MKAILNGHQIAASDDIVEVGGYHYFPPCRGADGVAGEGAEKTDHDRECPHGVQFYDVVIDGVRHAAQRLDLRSRRSRRWRRSRPRRLLGGRRSPLTAALSPSPNRASAADSGPADRPSP